MSPSRSQFFQGHSGSCPDPSPSSQLPRVTDVLRITNPPHQLPGPQMPVLGQEKNASSPTLHASFKSIWLPAQPTANRLADLLNEHNNYQILILKTHSLDMCQNHWYTVSTGLSGRIRDRYTSWQNCSLLFRPFNSFLTAILYLSLFTMLPEGGPKRQCNCIIFDFKPFDGLSPARLLKTNKNTATKQPRYALRTFKTWFCPLPYLPHTIIQKAYFSRHTKYITILLIAARCPLKAFIPFYIGFLTK